MKKKLLSILLSLAMVITMMPAMTLTSFATEEPDYFCITNTSGEDATVTWTMANNPDEINLKYKIGNGDWSTSAIEFVGEASSIALPAGQSIYFKNNTGKLNSVRMSPFGLVGYAVRCDKSHNVSGDITTLLSESGNVTDLTSAGTYTFFELFEEDKNLVSAENLKLTSTTLTECCYRGLFNGCSGLTTPPQLLALKMANWSYSSMFKGCTSLKTSPVLHATTLSKGCYSSMFEDSGLTTAPELPVTQLAIECYQQMFKGTKITKAPVLSATELSAGCYSVMFSNCENLTQAPVLPSTNLAKECYWSMFLQCTSLKKAPALPATILKDSCYKTMFYGCTALEAAPKLSATTLADGCFQAMFSGCEKLKSLQVYFNTAEGITNPFDIPGYGDIYKWLNNTALGDSGILYVPEENTMSAEALELPSNWTIQKGTPSEEYTIPVEGEGSVQIETTITEGNAEVKEITKESLEKVTKPEKGKKTTTDTIVIDLSNAVQEVTGVTLTKSSVQNLANVAASKKNNIKNVKIAFTNASVTLDSKALNAINDQAQGDSIQLVVDNTKVEELEPAQQESLSKYEVASTFEAYFEDGEGNEIHDFKGGVATVSLKFKPEKGKNAKNYKVYYIAETGKMTKYATKFVNGMLKFATTHFSDYAIVYDTAVDVLLLRSYTSGKKAVKLVWNAPKNVSKYVLYGARCGCKYRKIADVKGTKYTVRRISGKKLKAHKTYKFYVVAYDAVGNKIASRKVHFITATTSGRYANVKSIKAKKTSITLTVGGKAQKVGAKYKMYKGKKHIKKNHGTALRYVSTNPGVAKVSSSGKVTAVGAGTATIYIQDIGGEYCKTKVTVE